MPKYHLVSDLLNDLMIEDGGDFYRFGYLRKIIEDEWNDGNIELLIRHTKEEAPKVLEPLQRTLTIDKPASGERWIRCSICSPRDSGLIDTEFKNPFISDDDVQYVKRRAVAAGLVLAEPLNPTETQPSHLDHCVREPPNPDPEEIPASTPEEMAETENADIAKASSEVAIATLTGAIQSPEPEEILSPTTKETAETENADIAKASSEVAIAAPPQESEQQPTHRRCVYYGDLMVFMARKALPLLRRMDPKGIAKLYIEDHQERELQGKPVPQLPAPSNRLTRVARQAEKIRQGMEKEAARQAPPSVA